MSPATLPVPETWDDLLDAANARPGEWIEATAWAVGGGDPEGWEIRVPGGRAVYESAWIEFGSRGGARVRLARILPGDALGPRECVRWISPDAHLEARRLPNRHST